MSEGGSIPYVIGQWVCGGKFYGRGPLLEELRHGREHRRWIAGLRRIGKTSVLKELDRLERTARGGCLPLFWDLQGVDGAEDLALGFCDALLDAEGTLDRLGIALESVEDGELSVSLEKLRLALERRGARLLLLCDEVEDLFALEGRQEGLVSLLWRILGSFEGSRVVIASSIRLGQGAGWQESVRRLLEPFRDPCLLGTLEEEAARSLLLQDQLPAPSRPPLEGAAAETLLGACGGHPMLLQMAGKRYLELGDAAETLRQMAADRAVRHLHSVDFDLLSAEEREIMVRVASGGPPPSSSAARLLALGLLRSMGKGDFEIPNAFLAEWLLSKTS